MKCQNDFDGKFIQCRSSVAPERKKKEKAEKSVSDVKQRKNQGNRETLFRKMG